MLNIPTMCRLARHPPVIPGVHKSWKCFECGMPYSKSKLLEKHSRQTKHKAYGCAKAAACHKAVNMRTALIRHEASHSAQKNHACSRCSKSFHRRDHCQDHEAVCSKTSQTLPPQLVHDDRRQTTTSESLDPSNAAYPKESAAQDGRPEGFRRLEWEPPHSAWMYVETIELEAKLGRLSEAIRQAQHHSVYAEPTCGS